MNSNAIKPVFFSYASPRFTWFLEKHYGFSIMVFRSSDCHKLFNSIMKSENKNLFSLSF